VLRLYPAADQKTAIQFLDNVLARMPFPVEVIQTDNSAEFGTSFHWHALDKGMQHVYIKVRTPRLNGRVEHSSSTRTGSTHKALPTETRSETSQLRYGFAEEVNPQVKAWSRLSESNRRPAHYEEAGRWALCYDPGQRAEHELRTSSCPFLLALRGFDRAWAVNVGGPRRHRRGANAQPLDPWWPRSPGRPIATLGSGV